MLTYTSRVIDRPGLLTTSIDPATLREGQSNFLRDQEEVDDWNRDPEKGITLLEVVKKAKPTVLIGCSTMAGAFNEDVSSAQCLASAEN